MSLTKIEHAELRILEATKDSPILVSKANLRGRGYVNTAFASTVLSRDLIARGCSSILGCFYGATGRRDFVVKYLEDG